jgi:hypothetical protein
MSDQLQAAAALTPAGPKTGLVYVEWEKSFPYRDSNPTSRPSSPLASLYNDWAIPAPRLRK